MRKIWALLILGFLLNGCASGGGSSNSHYRDYANWANKIHKQDSRFKYFVNVVSKSSLKTMSAGSAKSYHDAYKIGCDGLKKHGYYDCVVLYRGNKQVYRIPTQRTYSSSSTSYGSSYSSSQSPLYYDPLSGGMRECTYNAVATGKCSSFKSYNRSSYNTNTLFYNPKTNTMLPCNGAVTSSGRCTAYGMFNYTKVTANKGQLFYDPRNQKMTTCRLATFSGGCSSYDIAPNSYARSAASSGWKMTPDPSNPSLKRVPRTSRQLIEVGLRMSNNQCTLGLNC